MSKKKVWYVNILLGAILLMGNLLQSQPVEKSQYLFGKKVPKMNVENLIALSLCNEIQFIKIMESYKMGDRIYTEGVLSFCDDDLSVKGFDDEGNFNMAEICYKLDDPDNILQVSYLSFGSKKKYILDELVEELTPYYKGRIDNGSSKYILQLPVEGGTQPFYVMFLIYRESDSNSITETVTVRVTSKTEAKSPK